MQVGRISNANVTANALRTTCVKKPCKNDLQSQPMNDTFVSSKGKNVSFGSGKGMLGGAGLGMVGGWILAGVATGGAGFIPAIVMTATGIVGAAGGGTIGDMVTGEDK